MQAAAGYIDHGHYLDTQVDDYDNIDVDVTVPEDSHRYEELQHIPQLAGKAGPDSDSTRQPPTPPVQAAASDHAAPNTCCRRPPCWGWAVLVAVVIIAAAVVGILAVVLTGEFSFCENLNMQH